MIQPPRPPTKRIQNKDISGSVSSFVQTAQTRSVPIVVTPRPQPPQPVQRPVVVQQRPAPAVVQQRPASVVIPNKPIPKVTVPVSGAQKANEIFLGCCKSINVAKPCERICNFDVLNKKTLTGMFLGTDPCPQAHGLDLMQCAAQSRDHTECCIERGVHTTSAGKKCLGFCNMKPGNSFQADVSMLPCWSVLNDIKSCFRDHIQSS
ncbi:DB module [Cooperia oncophora]